MRKNTTTQTLATEQPSYNPDDLDSVENFWEGSRIEHQGKIIGVSHRIKDWQTRMDEALIEYIETHHV